MVAGEDAIVPLILLQMLIDEIFSIDKAVHLGLLKQLLLDLNIEIGYFLVVLGRLLLAYREDVFQIVQVVVDGVGEANVDP